MNAIVFFFGMVYTVILGFAIWQKIRQRERISALEQRVSRLEGKAGIFDK